MRNQELTIEPSSRKTHALFSMKGKASYRFSQLSSMIEYEKWVEFVAKDGSGRLGVGEEIFEETRRFSMLVESRAWPRGYFFLSESDVGSAGGDKKNSEKRGMRECKVSWLEMVAWLCQDV